MDGPLAVQAEIAGSISPVRNMRKAVSGQLISKHLQRGFEHRGGRKAKPTPLPPAPRKTRRLLPVVAPVSPVPIQPTGEVNSFRRQMEMASKHWGSMLGTPRHIWKKFDHVKATPAISSYLAKHDLKKETDGEKAVITYNASRTGPTTS